MCSLGQKERVLIGPGKYEPTWSKPISRTSHRNSLIGTSVHHFSSTTHPENIKSFLLESYSHKKKVWLILTAMSLQNSDSWFCTCLFISGHEECLDLRWVLWNVQMQKYHIFVVVKCFFFFFFCYKPKSGFERRLIFEEYFCALKILKCSKYNIYLKFI